jgi:aminodeoxyfutalosine synthase
MSVEQIAEKLSCGARIDAAEAKLLWEEAPLWLLARLATEAKARKSGDKVFYNKNFHLEPTNICLFECRFCSYRRRKGEAGAWDYSMEEVLAQVEARKASGATEVHIVGGVHPERDIYYYV